MLRLRTSTLAHLLSTSERLLSATATPCISANPSSFAIGDYLVETCGLTRAQADKASAKVSHLKSPSKPDAVLAFLAGLGVSSTDVAPLVARDPEFLCARVDKTLGSNVADLTGLGLSRPEITRLVSLDPQRFRNRFIVSKLRYYLPLFGSSHNLFRALKHMAPTSSVLTSSRWSCPMSCSCDSVAYLIVILPSCAFLSRGC
jgi:mTERF domain-containing protein